MSVSSFGVPDGPLSRFLRQTVFFYFVLPRVFAYSDISDSESESASRSRFAAAEVMVTSVIPPSFFMGAGLYVPSSLAIASDFVFA